MVQTKSYETWVPLPRDEATAQELSNRGVELGTQWPIDNDLLVWLVWESFVKSAQNWALELFEFNDEGETPPENVPAEFAPVLEKMGSPAEDFVWRHFTGKARIAPRVEEALQANLEDQRAAILGPQAEAEPEEPEPPTKTTRRRKSDAESG